MRGKWRRRRVTALATMMSAALPGLFVATRYAGGNFGVVEPGRIYRSRQLSAPDLAGAIDRRGIKTVLNLRGASDLGWYDRERAASTSHGAAQVDVSMATDHWLSREQARTLVGVLDGAEKPLLIHCQWGAERTGLVSAMATLLRPGSTLDDARRQFSVWYLFVDAKDGRIMSGHLGLYESYLASRGLAHSPGRFRRWLTDDYVPPAPSREYWRRNPYPRIVVTRPRGEAR